MGVDEAEKERLLEQLRVYLDGIDTLPEPAPSSDPGSPETDLFSVFVELAAVRNELRTESRLVKEALDQFRGVFDTLQSSHATLQQELLRAQGEARERSQAMLRPLLSDLLELRDRLEAALQQPAAPPQRGWLDRWRQPLRAAAGTLARRHWHHGAPARSDPVRSPRIPIGAGRAALRSAYRACGRHAAGRSNSVPASWWKRCAPGTCGTMTCCAPPR